MFKVGDVVETIGRYGVGRQRGVVVDVNAQGSELLLVDFGDNFRRHRHPDECTIVEPTNDVPNRG